MNDPIVAAELAKRNFTSADFNTLLIYDSVSKKPRVLDKPPKRLSFKRPKDIQQLGFCSEFIIIFNQMKSETTLNECEIDLRGTVKKCGPNVFLALQTIIRQGFTFSKEKAEACFDLFKLIVMCDSTEITDQIVYDLLSDYQPQNYYAKELVKALRVCLFNEKVSVLYWLNLCEFTGFYSKARELGMKVIRESCTTEKDVETFLKPIYTEAKADEEFMSQLYKPACNKWLIPMLYYLRKEHPEALEPAGDGGFA